MVNVNFSGRGARLKAERKRVGVKTQEDLASLMSVTKQTVVRFEVHGDPMNVQHLDVLSAHGFDVPYILWGDAKSQMMGGESSQGNDNVHEDRLITAYRQTREEMREGLVVMVENFAKQFGE